MTEAVSTRRRKRSSRSAAVVAAPVAPPTNVVSKILSDKQNASPRAPSIDTARMEAIRNAIFAKEREVVSKQQLTAAEQIVPEAKRMRPTNANHRTNSTATAVRAIDHVPVAAPLLSLSLRFDDEDDQDDDEEARRAPIADEDVIVDTGSNSRRSATDAAASQPVDEIDDSGRRSEVVFGGDDDGHRHDDDDDDERERQSSSVAERAGHDSIVTSGLNSHRYPQTPRSQPEPIESVSTSYLVGVQSASDAATAAALPTLHVDGPTQFARNNAILLWLEQRRKEAVAENRRAVHLVNAQRAICDADFEVRGGHQAQSLRGIGVVLAQMIDDALAHFELCAENNAPFVVPGESRALPPPPAPVFVAPDSAHSLRHQSAHTINVPTRHTYAAEIEQAVVGGGALETLDAQWYSGVNTKTRTSLGLGGSP